MRITPCALVALLLTSGCFAESDAAVELELDAGAEGVLSLHDGSRAGGDAPLPVGLGADGGADSGADAGAQDGGDAGAGDPDAGTDAAADAGAEPSCVVLSDTFERPDGEIVGGPWIEALEGPDDPGDYDIVDGAMVRVDTGYPDGFDSKSTAVADQGESLPGLRLRFRAMGRVDVAFNTTGLKDGLRVHTGALGIELCEAVDCVSDGMGTYIQREYFHEVILDGTTLSGTTAEGGYASDGGTLIASPTRPVSPYAGSQVIVYLKDTFSELLDIELSRYPCD